MENDEFFGPSLTPKTRVYLTCCDTTGRIVQQCQMTLVNMQAYINMGFRCFLGEYDPEKHFALDDTMCARPELDIPSELRLQVGDTWSTSLPIGTTVDFDGNQSVLEDGALEISAVTVDAFELKLSCWPYLPKVLRVVVDG
ncbi:hypothetical protein [Rhizobium wenxiniae]|uniref:hypothetical protein n=1 Tax=Rhizobium wenxiniae TaxID=1737357 RepID=UPI003C295F63